MDKKLLFNTLSYAKMLDNGGVEHSDVHTTALHEALAQNIHSKQEVEQMLEAALKSFDKRTQQIRDDMRQEREEYSFQVDRRFNQLQMDIKDLRLDMKDEINEVRTEIKEVQEIILRGVYTALGIMLAVVALSSNLLHFTH